MDPTLSDEENLELIRRVFGVGPAEARFFLAIAKGEIEGDVIERPAEEALPKTSTSAVEKESHAGES